MKICYQILPFIMLVFITGCSSTFTIKDFSSREDFYGNFNKDLLNKKVTVTLLNDSSFTVNKGLIVRNDTLFNLFENVKDEKLSWNLIKKINYTSEYQKFPSADILLKDGEEINAKHIKFKKNHIEFDEVITTVSGKKIALVDSVKKVVFKDKLHGIIPGLVAGLFGGAGMVIIKSISNYQGSIKINWFLVGAASGIIVGTAIGWLVGYNYIYKFNP